MGTEDTYSDISEDENDAGSIDDDDEARMEISKGVHKQSRQIALLGLVHHVMAKSHVKTDF